MYNRYFDWLREHVLFIKHIKQYTYKDMLEQIGVSQDIGFNPDMLFIDPYNSLKKDGRKNDHNYDYEAIEDFRIFTQNTKVSIFLNCHTNTEAQRVKPDKNGETPRPISADVEGGGKFLNKSDDVWVIHRHLHHMDKEERYVSHLYIDKVNLFRTNRLSGNTSNPPCASLHSGHWRRKRGASSCNNDQSV